MTPSDFMDVCRLCLVKDKVSVPIFEGEGEKRQIFTKIATCLPVKVEKHDCLPKKICDVCLYTIESVFKFWNTTASSEKILLQWLEGIDNVEKSTLSDSFVTEELILKEERGDKEQNEVLKSQDNKDSADDAGRHENEGCSDEDGLNSESNYVEDKFVEKNDGTEVDGGELEPTTFVNISMACNELEGSSMVQTEQIQTESVQLQGDLQSRSTTQVQVVPEAVPSTSKNVADSSGSRKKTLPKLTTEERKLQKTCEFCGKKFSKLCYAIEHRYTHTGERPYLCELCGSSFTSPRYFKKHIRDTHSEKGKFACDICGVVYKKQYLLKNHKYRYHGDKKLVCDVCGYKARFRGNLITHEKRHFKMYSEYCDICKKGFYTKAELRNHMEAHVGIKFKCQICDKDFTLKHNLKKHVMISHGQTHLKCNLCYKKFVRPELLEKHYVQCSEQSRSSVCSVCGKVVTNAFMKIHLRTHSGERPAVCKICNKAFRSANNLKTHSLVHTGEKPHSCKLCEKCFTQRSSLVIHMRSHSGEKPFCCNICSKRYVTRTLLVYHQRTHTMGK